MSTDQSGDLSGVSDFAHLHLHTQYSLLDGAIRTRDLCKTVHERGMKSVAVTDHGNMFGAVQFYEEAKKLGNAVSDPDLEQELKARGYSPKRREEEAPKLLAGAAFDFGDEAEFGMPDPFDDDFAGLETTPMEQEEFDQQTGDAAAAAPPTFGFRFSNGDVTLHKGISANHVPVAGKKRFPTPTLLRISDWT